MTLRVGFCLFAAGAGVAPPIVAPSWARPASSSSNAVASHTTGSTARLGEVPVQPTAANVAPKLTQRLRGQPPILPPYSGWKDRVDPLMEPLTAPVGTSINGARFPHQQVSHSSHAPTASSIDWVMSVGALLLAAVAGAVVGGLWSSSRPSVMSEATVTEMTELPKFAAAALASTAAGQALLETHPALAGTSAEPDPWWDNVERLDSLKLEDLQRLCASSLKGQREQQAAVVRNALESEWVGAEGRVLEACSETTLSLFTAGHDGQNTFSRGLHQKLRSLVQPSVALWQQLASSKQAWAMRGDLELDPADLSDLLGGSVADIRTALVEGGASVSLFSGAGGTRTPLHVDNIHALIYQVEGTKRLFLSSRPDVSDAVSRGTLPDAVLHDGSTDVFCVDGSLEEVHGLSQSKPARAHGSFVELHPGDCLVLPAGLYHDVEATPDAPASLSLTVRFDSAMIAEGSLHSLDEILLTYSLPTLAFHGLVWMSTVALTDAGLSLCDSEAHEVLRYLPEALAQRLSSIGDADGPLDRALRIADALGAERMALSVCAAPLLSRISKDVQLNKLIEDMLWKIDDSLDGSLRKQLRAASSTASRFLTRS